MTAVVWDERCARRSSAAVRDDEIDEMKRM